MFNYVVSARVDQIKGSIFAQQWLQTASESSSGSPAHVKSCHKRMLNLSWTEILSIARTITLGVACGNENVTYR